MTSTRARAAHGIGFLVLMISASTLLTGCGGSTGASDSVAAPTVASVDTPPQAGTPAVTKTKAAAEVRPVLRADATEEEENRLMDVWYECTYKHGVPRPKPGPADGGIATGGSDAYDSNDPRYASAWKACASKEPEDYKDHLRRTDPDDYDTRARQFHKCLKGRHVKVQPVKGKDNPDNDPMIFSFDNDSAGSGLDAADKCEKVAFGSVK